jgi:nucleoside 2-deoxyribosyltransferase
MNRLKNLGVYLSGPIDFSPDRGKGWRDEITPFLEEKGVRVFNPLNHHKTFHIKEDIDTVKRPYMRKLLSDGKFDELQYEMRELVHYDLRAIDLASFLIVNYDTSIHLCGTVEEISIASKQVKPVLLIAKNGKDKLPQWLYGRLPHSHFFANTEEVKNYLTQIDSNPDYQFTKVDLKRWTFFEGPHMQ